MQLKLSWYIFQNSLVIFSDKSVVVVVTYIAISDYERYRALLRNALVNRWHKTMKYE